jgi:hypothetical protein
MIRALHLYRRLAGHGSLPPGNPQWLLGLPASQQVAVYASLLQHGGEVLHPLPGDHHHWLITATPGAVSDLLDRHPDLTVVRAPLVHAGVCWPTQ